MPKRAPGQTGISVSIGEELLAQVDARASALGLNRSQYFAFLARQDLMNRQPLALQEMPSGYAASVSSTVSGLADDAERAVPATASRKPVAAPVHYSKRSTPRRPKP